MKKLSILVTILAFTLSASSQEFRQAIGLRGGITPGFEYRVFSDETNSYKFLLSSRDNGIQFHAIREFHSYGLFSFSDQLNFVYGVGLHAGYIRYGITRLYYNTHYYDRTSAFIGGLDGLAGLEYDFLRIPISAGVEVKPFFDLFGEQLFYIQPFDFAFTLKYRF